MTQPLALPGVFMIPFVVHSDQRGFLAETFQERDFHSTRFVQDNHSYSALEGTLRGLHYQKGLTKLVRVVKGKIYDVIVDIRPGSPRYGEYIGIEISGDDFYHLYVPDGMAHGFITLEPETEVVYKMSDYFNPALDAGIVWDDPEVAVEWPIEPVVLSQRDRTLPTLRAVRDSS